MVHAAHIQDRGRRAAAARLDPEGPSPGCATLAPTGAYAGDSETRQGAGKDRPATLEISSSASFKRRRDRASGEVLLPGLGLVVSAPPFPCARSQPLDTRAESFEATGSPCAEASAHRSQASNSFRGVGSQFCLLEKSNNLIPWTGGHRETPEKSTFLSYMNS